MRLGVRGLRLHRGDRPSISVFALAAALREADVNVKVNKRGGVYPGKRHMVMNWGVSNASFKCDLNKPEQVDVAIDKARAFAAMKEAGVSVPEFADKLPETIKGKWLARTKLRSSAGDGIVVIRDASEAPAAPLYVKYVPKIAEFRVHVAFGKAIATQEKRRRSDTEQTDDQKLIRNADNGWVFCVEAVEFDNDEQRQEVEAECVKAVQALGLDFGAVDVILGRDDDKPYVLEVNTAPGLSSPTVLSAYVAAIKEKLSGSQS